MRTDTRDTALAELERRGVTGKGPRLSFCRLYFEYTDEASLAASTARIQHNAGGAELAVSLNNS